MNIFILLLIFCSLAFNSNAQPADVHTKTRNLKDIIYSKKWKIVQISDSASHKQLVEFSAEPVEIKFVRNNMYIINSCNDISYKFSISRNKLLKFKMIEKTLAGCGVDAMQREEKIIDGFNQVQSYNIVYKNDVKIVLKLENGEEWTLN